MPPLIAITLATYNGMPYLEDQVKSILAQSHENKELYVRDDASIDGTAEHLSSFNARMICHNLQDELGQLGVVGNFSRLLEAAYSGSAQYFALSDQDDIWHPYKLTMHSKVLDRLSLSCPNSPILVYSDMKVVDAELNLISPSFMGYQGICHESDSPLSVLLAQNFVTGCASMFNRQLLDVALPFPEEVIMHDWWLALCAASMGHIEYIGKPLVQYRQHGGNQVGAKKLAAMLNPQKNNWLKCWSRGRDVLLSSMHQARALAERVREIDPKNANLPLIDAYAGLFEIRSPIARVCEAQKLNIRVQSSLRHSLFLSRLMLMNWGR